jgi:FkbM family methyltransferase
MNERLQDLEHIQQLTKSNKLTRIISRPLKYLKGHALKQISQRTKKGYSVKIQTFFKTQMQLLLPSGLDIYLFGAKTHDSEIRLTKYLIKHLNKDSIFFDVGAHFGYFSLLAEACGCTSIYAFEASKNNFAILQENTKNKKIHIQNTAIYSGNGEIEFYEFPTLYAENNTVKLEQFKSSDWISANQPTPLKVNGITLDSFIKEHGIVPDIIKLDVEGAELEVLKGLKESFGKYSMTICLEYIIDKNMNSSHQEAYFFLIANGFQPFLILDNGMLKAISDLSTLNNESKVVSENLILISKV